MVGTSGGLLRDSRKPIKLTVPCTLILYFGQWKSAPRAKSYNLWASWATSWSSQCLVVMSVDNVDSWMTERLRNSRECLLQAGQMRGNTIKRDDRRRRCGDMSVHKSDSRVTDSGGCPGESDIFTAKSDFSFITVFEHCSRDSSEAVLRHPSRKSFVCGVVLYDYNVLC